MSEKWRINWIDARPTTLLPDDQLTKLCEPLTAFFNEFPRIVGLSWKATMTSGTNCHVRAFRLLFDDADRAFIVTDMEGMANIDYAMVFPSSLGGTSNCAEVHDALDKLRQKFEKLCVQARLPHNRSMVVAYKNMLHVMGMGCW